MKKRVVSFLLLICTVLSFCVYPVVMTATSEEHYSVIIKADGKKVSEIIVAENEKKELTAECTPVNSKASYQWEICMDEQNDLWVEIQGENERSIALSYPMIASLIDMSGSVYIRSRLTINEKKYYSDSVRVIVAFSEKKFKEEKAENVVPLQKRKSPISMGMKKAADQPEYVSITINYLDWTSRNPVYSPYTATVAYGTAFSQVVTSPTFMGYAPYTVSEVDGVNVFTPSTSYTLNYATGELTSDISINIYYKAIEVGYSVRYYFQNIANDLYTEKTELFKNGMAETGSIVDNDDLEADVDISDGFTKLYHYPESVAADSSTIFECYYDRNYYLYKFDLNGGYGVDPIYARYETSFAISNPVRHGYVFSGWADVTDDASNSSVATLPNTIGAGNKTYKAIWSTIETTYSVIYWLENADDENGEQQGNGYSYWWTETLSTTSNNIVSGTDNQELPSALRTAFPEESHYSVFAFADGDTVVNGDGSTVVNVYYDRKEYNLKFYYAMDEVDESENPLHHYVVGGSTYYFGRANNASSNKWNEIITLDQYNTDNHKAKNQRGEVDVLPTLNEKGLTKGYTLSHDVSTVNGKTYHYYYLMFSAKYGSRIDHIWPSDVFNHVTRITGGENGSWSGRTAYPSAWNGENNVYYSQKNSNETIKGKYSVLDKQILWDYNKFGEPDDDTVSFLCFWENGANISWSIPRRFQYKIWLSCLDDVDYSEYECKIPELADFNGQTISGMNEVIGNQYYLYDDYATYDDSNVSQQTKPGLIGFTPILFFGDEMSNASIETDINGQPMYQNYFECNIAYRRNIYTLQYMNYGSNVPLYQGNVPYEADISETAPDLQYPETLEPNAYYFDGWYTTPEGYEGTEYNLENATMPAKNLTLYAVWKPKTHIVRFFRTYTDMLEYENTLNEEFIYYEKSVKHSETVGVVETPENPYEHDYIFSGWFYTNSDNKINMFAEYDSRIGRDINVYANWGSKLARPYRIHYAQYSKETDTDWLNAISSQEGSPVNQKSFEVTCNGVTREYVYIEENNGYHRLVANDTIGYAYEGATRTFFAKAGAPFNQLHDNADVNFNDGYFPTLASHSIIVESERMGIEQPENNVFTFFYVKPSNPISYRVNYLDKQTNLPVAEPKLTSTTNGVITERFSTIINYIPDAFYKRLILSVHDDGNGNWVGSDQDNVINFYYTPNENAAYYAVHYMLQKPGTTGTNYNTTDVGDYVEDESIIEGIADINSTVDINPLLFDGFERVDEAIRVNNGTETSVTSVDNKYQITITSEGSELYIYYTRKKYDIAVHYLKYNSAEPVNSTDHPHYTIKDVDFGVQSPTYTADLTIEDSSGISYALVDVENRVKSTVARSNEAQNVIIFYYIENEYTVEYQVAGGTGGNLTKTIEIVRGNDSFLGSEAFSSENYEFVGWYLDEECKNPVTVDEGLDAENPAKIKPEISYLHPIPAHNIFYAKFSILTYDLTIIRENADDESNGNQVFVYEITDKNNIDNVYYVTIKTEDGTGTVTIHDLPSSDYEVKQINDWSWRYEDEPQQCTLNEDKTIIFGDSTVNDKWLNANSAVIENMMD